MNNEKANLIFNVALVNGDTFHLKRLVESGSFDVNGGYEMGESYLFMTVCCGVESVFKFLIENGDNINMKK